MNINQKIYNALWTQAIADAVGNPFEFKDRIKFNAVIDYFKNDFEKLVISDDTQMAMFGFEAMHNLMSEYPVLDALLIETEFTNAYLDWLKTQSEMDIFRDKSLKTGLLQFSSMFSIQSPGTTCLGALHNIKNGVKYKNDSKGCGSVMRLLPVLLLYGDDRIMARNEIIKLAQITGAITHHHKENGDAIALYMTYAMDLLSGGKSYIDHSMILQKKFEDITKIEEIGTGWTALEAVEMAIWAYANADSFEDLLALSVAHGGDSDSVAAIAGSLWGLAGREWDKSVIKRLDAVDALVYLTLSRVD